MGATSGDTSDTLLIDDRPTICYTRNEGYDNSAAAQLLPGTDRLSGKHPDKGRPDTAICASSSPEICPNPKYRSIGDGSGFY
jgi:hypothetical protein